jgi:hypothetical protein
MNTWWVSLVGEELGRRWRLWSNEKFLAELRLVKRWVKESEPMAEVRLHEDYLKVQRSKIMKAIFDPEPKAPIPLRPDIP